jgi:hypothetical protein
MFTGTLVYELDPTTSADARKLLRAELVGRRWNDRYENKRMPDNCLWIRRNLEPGENVDDLAARARRELHAAVEAVARTGLKIRLVRGWVQITGAGTYGLIDAPAATEQKV